MRIAFLNVVWQANISIMWFSKCLLLWLLLCVFMIFYNLGINICAQGQCNHHYHQKDLLEIETIAWWRKVVWWCKEISCNMFVTNANSHGETLKSLKYVSTEYINTLLYTIKTGDKLIKKYISNSSLKSCCFPLPSWLKKYWKEHYTH